MPRLKNRPPKMTRNRNTAVVYIDGQTVRLGPWGSAEARETSDRLIAEWLANGRKLPGPTAEDEQIAVTEIVVEFLKHARRRYERRHTKRGCIVVSARGRPVFKNRANWSKRVTIADTPAQFLTYLLPHKPVARPSGAAITSYVMIEFSTI